MSHQDLEDRPPSELSDYAVSSGYGSTRSHKPPDGSGEPSAASDNNASLPKLKAIRKCSTIRRSYIRTRPQFRSLRRLASLTKKNKAKEKEKNNNDTGAAEAPEKRPAAPVADAPSIVSYIPKIPAKTPPKPPSSPPPDPPEETKEYLSERPVPAPRKYSPSAPPRPPPPRHTYQNVPVPIEPNAAQLSNSSGLPAVSPKVSMLYLCTFLNEACLY